MYNDSLFNAFARSFEARSETDMSMAEYLEACRDDPMRYANAAERLLAAIGEPEMVDTAKDARLGRIFMNRTIRFYPAFAEFYGMEETIERIVGLLPPRRAGPRRAQADPLSARPGRRRQVLARRAPEGADGRAADLCAEGRRRAQPGVRKPARPVRSGAAGADARGRIRHSAAPADRADEPVVLQAARRIRRRHHAIPRRQDHAVAAAPDRRSPRPSRATRTTRTSPRWSARSISASSRCFAQNDPDAYSYSGGLNRANQGILEFVEMFKAPIKMLHPLLTATQEGNYIGTENIGAIPFTRHHHGALERGRMADLQEQQEQRSLHRPHLRDQGAVLPARAPKSRRSTRS